MTELSGGDVYEVLTCQSAAESVEAWKDCGVKSPVRVAGAEARFDVRLVSDSNTLNFPATNVQWARMGAILPDPNAKPDCDPDSPMTPFIPDCQ